MKHRLSGTYFAITTLPIAVSVGIGWLQQHLEPNLPNTGDSKGRVFCVGQSCGFQISFIIKEGIKSTLC